MHARIGTYSGDGEALRAGFEGQTQALEQLDGFKGGYFLIDADGGKGMSVTLWESEDALRASAERAKEMRAAATEPSGASIDSVDNYEVVITVGV